MNSTPKTQSVLMVDRETDFLAWAQHQLEAAGIRVLQATGADEAYRIFCQEEPDLVFTEMNLAPDTGQDLLIKVRKHSPNAMVIVTSAFGTTQAVIETMKLGAFDFVRKEQLPFNLKIVVEAALKAQAELRRASAPKPQLTVEQHQDTIVGQSDAMQQVFKMVGRVAASEAPVMITGESGSGKELVARAIHHYSQRQHKTFLAINCAAIPENLLESELFGHEKGAFTGAHNQRIGRFEQCDGGTLFLDEIGEMPMPTQSKLLRVLQEGEFSRVGGNETIRTDVRIVAATNKILEDEVARKTFREDLFYRLNVVRIHLPPLRQRVEDIQLLAEYFLQRIANKKFRPLLKLSEEAIAVLEAYPWPGNVRELENTMERACVLATTDVLLPKDIPLGHTAEGAPISGSSIPAPSGDTASPALATPVELVKALYATLAESAPGAVLETVESALLQAAMEAEKGQEAQAAKVLGITRANLKKRLPASGNDAGSAS